MLSVQKYHPDGWLSNQAITCSECRVSPRHGELSATCYSHAHELAAAVMKMNGQEAVVKESTQTRCSSRHLTSCVLRGDFGALASGVWRGIRLSLGMGSLG